MKYKAVVFDVDGVLTEIESIWKFIHEKLGTWSIARKYAEMFKRKEIDYVKWAELDVSLWKGVSFSKILEIIREVKLREGGEELIRFLKSKGLKTVAISAGLDVLANHVANVLSIDKVVSNRLVIKNNVVTGEVDVKVLYDNKDVVLENVCRELGISPLETITVGDSEVDLPMMLRSGFSIAVNPTSDKIVKAAKRVVYLRDLRELIPVFNEILR